MSFHAIIVDRTTGFVCESRGHYDEEKLRSYIKDRIGADVNRYALFGEEAVAYTWQREYDRLTAVQRWMIDTALRDIPTIAERRKHAVTKLVSVAQARIIKAGFTTVCGRCGGTGNYSYNQIDGTICYGCRGRKQALIKLTAGNKRRIEAYFEEQYRQK